MTYCIIKSHQFCCVLLVSCLIAFSFLHWSLEDHQISNLPLVTVRNIVVYILCANCSLHFYFSSAPICWEFIFCFILSCAQSTGHVALQQILSSSFVKKTFKKIRGSHTKCISLIPTETILSLSFDICFTKCKSSQCNFLFKYLCLPKRNRLRSNI